MLVTKSTNCAYSKTLKKKYFSKNGVPEVESGGTAHRHLVPHFHTTCHRDSLNLKKHIERFKIVKTRLDSHGEREGIPEIPATLQNIH